MPISLRRPPVCIVSPVQGAYSETFIRAHIERLPTEVHVLFGGPPPTHANGTPLVNSYNLWQSALFRLGQQLRGRAWDYRAKAVKAVERYLRRHGIQAVLAEYGHSGVAVMDACQNAGVPLIVHFHGADAYKADMVAQLKDDYARLFRVSARIIAVSSDMRERLLHLGAPEAKLCVNPCGADVEEFTGADPANSPPIFVAAGRFVDKKGPVLTLLAFRQVLLAEPKARLVMIGDGPLLDVSRQVARVLNFAHAVNFPGARPHAEVAAAMRGARAFVQHSLRPSDGDSEGTPVAVVEASAAGLPVIATRHGGIRDVVVDGVTGLLVDEGDWVGMAQAMLEMLQDPQRAACMGQAGRARVVERFSMDKSIGNLWAIIGAVIQERSDAT